MFHANIYRPLDGGMVILQHAAGSYHTKKLCGRIYLIKIEFYSQKKQKNPFEPPFGVLRGNVCTLSMARWKACGRLYIYCNRTFFTIFYG